MRKYIFFILFTAVCCLFINFDLSFAKENITEMTIKKVSKNLIIADKGDSQGIQKNLICDIAQEGRIIGQAKVLLIEDDMCGLKIIKLDQGYEVKPGDSLLVNPKENELKNKGGYRYRHPKWQYCCVIQSEISTIFSRYEERNLLPVKEAWWESDSSLSRNDKNCGSLYKEI